MKPEAVDQAVIRPEISMYIPPHNSVHDTECIRGILKNPLLYKKKDEK
jgi:hypothetical protein